MEFFGGRDGVVDFVGVGRECRGRLDFGSIRRPCADTELRIGRG